MNTNKKYRIPKKYACIVKVKCKGCHHCTTVYPSGKKWQEKDCINDSFKKWNTNDLLKFVEFLDDKHNAWVYFNVYDKKTRQQIASFTKKNRPISRTV